MPSLHKSGFESFVAKFQVEPHWTCWRRPFLMSVPAGHHPCPEFTGWFAEMWRAGPSRRREEGRGEETTAVILTG